MKSQDRVECPAKINLTLAVIGRGANGFHDLVSLVAPLAFGDYLTVRRETGSGVQLELDGVAVPCGEQNLVLKAAHRFLADFPAAGRFVFTLNKRIPVGAGLGGGSSDAAGTLVLLNRILGSPAGRDALHLMACDLGSDCPFFLRSSPAIMRGRGDRLEWLNPSEAANLLGRRVILCKPFPGVSTAWAYGALARIGRYSDPDDAETALAAWRNGDRSLESLLINDFETPVGAKYPGIALLLRELRVDGGLPAMMSGSGSACFVLPGQENGDRVIARIREAWGANAFCVETTIGQKDIDHGSGTG